MSIKKMNPEIKTEWVTALRSGQYKQGVAALRSGEDEFCCLGVLCEIAVKHGVIEPAAGGGDGEDYSYEARTAFLPPVVAGWAELADPMGEIRDEGHLVADLAGMNDGLNSFELIADTIEELL
jgi:hypothetical protein